MGRFVLEATKGDSKGMRRGTIGIMLVIFSLMTVLRGGSEIEHQAFVFSIGIDQEENGLLLVSIQIPNAKREGELSGGGSGDLDGNEIIEASATTYVNACDVLDASIPRDINFTQVSQVVISEELAKQSNFSDLLDDVLHSKNIRKSATLVICRGKAKEFINAQTSFLGVRISVNISTHLKLAKALGIIPNAMIGEVVRMSYGAWRDAIVPYATLNAHQDMEELMDSSMEDLPLDVHAGDLPEMSTSRIEYAGAVLLLDGRMVGSLTGVEVQFLSFIMGDIEEFTFLVDDVYYHIRQMGAATTQVVKNGDGYILRVKGHILAGELRHGTANEERLRNAFTYEMLKLLEKLQALGVDPIGFQGKAVRSVLTIRDWPQAEWVQQYKNATIEVELKVTIGEVH